MEAISSAEINKVAELAARHTVLGQKSKRLQRLRASVTGQQCWNRVALYQYLTGRNGR